MADKDLSSIFIDAAGWANLVFFGLLLFYLSTLVFTAPKSIGKWGVGLTLLFCSFLVTGPVTYMQGGVRGDVRRYSAQTKKWIEQTEIAISDLARETQNREKVAEHYDECARQRDGIRLFVELLVDSKVAINAVSMQEKFNDFCAFERTRYIDQRKNELAALDQLNKISQTKPARPDP